jgi:hypothetical protein
MLAIGVEIEYRFVARSLSGWGPKGEPNASTTIGSEDMNSLKLIQRSDSTMLAIGVGPEYGSISRSLSGWGPNGEPNAPITAGSKNEDSLMLICSCSCSSGLL